MEAEVDAVAKCPGIYCGRRLLAEGNWSECGGCPRGFRANATSHCQPCRDSPVFYDWLYLGFMTFLPLLLHFFFIDNTTPFRTSFFSLSRGGVVLHLCAALEIAVAAVLTVLIVEPFGEVEIESCRVESLSDWYTLFHNPTPHYDHTLHCTQEAVYPLHTMVFIFYCLAVGVMLAVRPLVIRLVLTNTRSAGATIYAALYFFPMLALFHSVCGGLIYYTFPYIVIVLSVISNAAHFAFKMDQSVEFLVKSSVSDLRNVIIVVGHWVVHGYGLLSLTELRRPLVDTALLSLVPLPALFYIVTARFTDPHKLHSD